MRILLGGAIISIISVVLLSGCHDVNNTNFSEIISSNYPMLSIKEMKMEKDPFADNADFGATYKVIGINQYTYNNAMLDFFTAKD